MNEGYMAQSNGIVGCYDRDVAAKQAVMLSTRNTTVAQNIDNRIAILHEQIERLQAVKAKLSSGSILDVSLDDLQMAMGRY